MERGVIEDESADGTWKKREEWVLGNRRSMVNQGNGGVMVEAWWNKGKEG